MTKDKRLFAVENNRRQKRLGAPSDGVWKLEHKENNGPKTAASASESELGEEPPVQRRIFDALDQPSFQPEMNLAHKNRDPGFKNSNVKIEAQQSRRAREQLLRNPDNIQEIGLVPKTSSAALQSISKENFGVPKTPLPKGATYQVPLFEPLPKRKRGRPRKIRPPKFDWTEWMVDGEPEPSDV